MAEVAAVGGFEPQYQVMVDPRQAARARRLHGAGGRGGEEEQQRGGRKAARDLPAPNT